MSKLFQIKQNFHVIVRIRPILANKEAIFQNDNIREMRRESAIQSNGNTVILKGQQQHDQQFVFDQVFDQTNNTNEIYQSTIQPMIRQFINGYNQTVFAYGMTGAGKTYTMFGKQQENEINVQQKGIIQQSVEDIFRLSHRQSQLHPAWEKQLSMTYIEIYNEHVRDLLCSLNQFKSGDKLFETDNLTIVDDPDKGICAQGVTEIKINSFHEFTQCLEIGNKLKRQASTNSNECSSRSHAILQITYFEKQQNHNPIQKDQKDKLQYQTVIIKSKLSLVDLAGSERNTTNNTYIRMREEQNINKSLLALGNCINVLSNMQTSQQEKGHQLQGHVPFRNSKLTRFLMDSLGGNAQTCLIACISPASYSYQETLSTLKYAQRAAKIVTNSKQNIINVDHFKTKQDPQGIIPTLQNEIAQLKQEIRNQRQINSSFTNNISQYYRKSNTTDIQAEIQQSCKTIQSQFESVSEKQNGLHDSDDVQFFSNIKQNQNYLLSDLEHIKILETNESKRNVNKNMTTDERHHQNHLNPQIITLRIAAMEREVREKDLQIEKQKQKQILREQSCTKMSSKNNTRPISASSQKTESNRQEAGIFTFESNNNSKIKFRKQKQIMKLLLKDQSHKTKNLQLEAKVQQMVEEFQRSRQMEVSGKFVDRRKQMFENWC